MKQYLTQSIEILEDKFKVKPNKSKIFLYENIQEFLKGTRNPEAQSMFLPRSLSAHVPRDRLDLAIHEYLGHGVYCEHTSYGRKMVEDEKRFDSMVEDEVKIALSLHERMKVSFEGHALWTEDYLLRELEKDDVLEARLKELTSMGFSSSNGFSSYKDVYDVVKCFEEEKGVYELWYSLGLPRRFDDETLIDIAKEKLRGKFDDIVFLIHFGSTNEQGDIDLCAVIEDEVRLQEYVHSRTIDFCGHNYSNFRKKAKLLDVTTIQPLLTGRLIYGDSNEFEKLKGEVKGVDPISTVDYLREKSKWCLEYAIKALGKQEEWSNALEVCLNNLAYSLSFRECAKRYSGGEEVIVYNELRNPLLKEIRNYMKGIEYKKEMLAEERVKDFINKVKTI